MSENLTKLLKTMETLRDPEKGCAWDLEQNFHTIAPHTIEEAYEVADAIERENMNDLQEELGDLLLQVVFHSQLAKENGLFDFEQVAGCVNKKMLRRHPHIFGSRKAETAEQVMYLWEDIKDEERALKYRQNRNKQSDKIGLENARNLAGEEEIPEGALGGVALSLPALLRTEKLQKKAERAGFRWKCDQNIIDKLEEEIAELKEALHGSEHACAEELEDEFGDVLFVLVNLGRRIGVSAETALRKANDKFTRRFTGLEQDLRKKNYKIDDCTQDKLKELWQRQKLKLQKKAAKDKIRKEGPPVEQKSS